MCEEDFQPQAEEMERAENKLLNGCISKLGLDYSLEAPFLERRFQLGISNLDTI